MKTLFSALVALIAWTSISSAGMCIVGKTVIQEGENFPRSPCTTCLCRDGKLECSRPVCPPLHCGFYEDPGTHEGECCPVCIPREVVDPAPVRRPPAGSCSQEGEFVDPANPCRTCNCQNGHKLCWDTSDTCEPLACEGIVHVPGQCCPQCMTAPAQMVSSEPATCMNDNGEVISSGSSFSRDPCTTCTCSNGMLLCSTQDCVVPKCPNGEIPVARPGECCLTCPPTPPQETCTEGHTRRGGDCRVCRCINGEYECIYDQRSCRHAHSQFEIPDRKGSAESCETGAVLQDGCWSCKCIKGKFECKRDSVLCKKSKRINQAARN